MTLLFTDDKSNNNNIGSKAYFNFVHSIRSPATRKVYEFAIRKYRRFHHLNTIDELLVANKDNDPTTIEDQIIEWIVALRKTITYSTRHTYTSALLTFYEINDINVRRKRVARFLGEQSTRTNNDRAYTTEEIHRLLEYADIRSKALVLLLASSGMRIGAVTDLKLRHLKKIPEYNLYKIIVYQNTKDEHYTFCTPECAASIDAYIAYRESSGERITEDTPVIRESFDNMVVKNIGGVTKKKPEPVATDGIGAIITTLLLKSGVTNITSRSKLQELGKFKGSVRKAVKRAHGLRKFFNSNLDRAKVSFSKKEMMLGHSLGLDDAYLRLSEEEVLAEYLKAVDSLTINNENRLQKQVTELTQKHDDIEIMKAEHQRKDLELREQMQQQQQQYQHMIEEFQERDRKEKEESRKEIMGYLKATRILVDLPEQEEAATTTAMKKSNKAYYLQPEDTETKETLKKAQTRVTEQLRKDTVARHSHSLRSIKNRIQQHQQP